MEKSKWTIVNYKNLANAILFFLFFSEEPATYNSENDAFAIS